MLLAILLQAATAFNLECSGTTVSLSTLLGRKVTPFQRTYRLDLVRKVYCEGSCETTLPIADVTPKYIVLSEYERETERERTRASVVIDRVGGTIDDTSISRLPIQRGGDLAVSSKGGCIVQPFTAFPEPLPAPPQKF